MVTEEIFQADQYRAYVRELLRRESANSRVLKLPKHQHVYTCGDRDSAIYLIESGRIKLLVSSADGKECVTAVYGPGDFFGERCLCGPSIRSETAVTMRDSALRQVPCTSLLTILRREPLLGAFVQCLVARIAEKEDAIMSLLSVKSEQRLAMTLLRLARRLGKQAPGSTCIDHRFSQEELAEMVGTTRSRIGLFLKRFREYGLIEISERRQLVIKEEKLGEYIQGIALARGSGPDCEQRMNPRCVGPALSAARTLGVGERVQQSDGAAPPKGPPVA